MKRFLSLLILVLSAISSYGEEKLVEKPRFFDNWSLTVSGGAYHPMIYDVKYIVDCSGYGGAVELRKQITPTFGLGFEGNGYYRMSRDERKDPRTVIGPVVHLNLMNLFGGYKGRPRVFEIEAGIMPGWGHLYRGTNSIYFPDENFFATKFGADLNFNLGKARAWTIALKPAIVYDMAVKHGNQYESYDINYADVQLMVGVTYHFRNHNGKRHFNYGVAKTDEDEIARLNESVNFLRSDVKQRDTEIGTYRAKVESLEEDNERLRQNLDIADSREPIVIHETKTETVTKKTQTLESMVLYRQGLTTVDASQYPNVERVATYLNHHPNATVSIKGYASPDGDSAINVRLANERAQSVRNLLIVKYGIAPERIQAEGQNIGDMFSEPDWNRVAICTIIENE